MPSIGSIAVVVLAVAVVAAAYLYFSRPSGGVSKPGKPHLAASSGQTITVEWNPPANADVFSDLVYDGTVTDVNNNVVQTLTSLASPSFVLMPGGQVPPPGATYYVTVWASSAEANEQSPQAKGTVLTPTGSVLSHLMFETPLNWESNQVVLDYQVQPKFAAVSSTLEFADQTGKVIPNLSFTGSCGQGQCVYSGGGNGFPEFATSPGMTLQATSQAAGAIAQSPQVTSYKIPWPAIAAPSNVHYS